MHTPSSLITDAKQNRIPSLDGLRAISILLVVLSHLPRSFHTKIPVPVIDAALLLGKIGVEIFFVISGFLITLLLIREKEQTDRIDLKSFYIRRVLRIFPAFYFYLIVLGILNYLMDLRIPFSIFLGTGLYLQNFAPWGSDWLIAHTWSLAVEEQFYIFWPLLFGVVRKSRVLMLWILSFAMGSAMRSIQYKFPELSVYFLAPFFKHADFLFSGACMAFVFHYHKDVLKSYINRVHPGILYVIVFVMCLLYFFEFHPAYDIVLIPIAGTIVNGGICFLIFYFIIREDSSGYRILNSDTAIFFGQLSYSLYIWQQLFFSGSDHWFAKFPVNIIMTLIAALISYYAVERPFLNLKKRFNLHPRGNTSVT